MSKPPIIELDSEEEEEEEGREKEAEKEIEVNDKKPRIEEELYIDLEREAEMQQYLVRSVCILAHLGPD